MFFSFAPMSFLFVIGYSEGLFMLLMFAGMLLAIKRRYLWILPIGLITAYTRPGVWRSAWHWASSSSCVSSAAVSTRSRCASGRR